MALIDRSVEDPAARAERDDAWRSILAGLSTTQRAVVVLKFRHSMTFLEIGFALGMSDSGANRIYLAALQHLRDTGKFRALIN